MDTCIQLGNRLLGSCPAVAIALALLAPPAFAANNTQEGPICMQRTFMGPTATVSNSNLVNCTANDIKISKAISVSPAKCTAGQTFDLTATFEVNVTANSRYDAAFFFRIDGGANARGDGTTATGQCSMTQLDPAVAPALQLDGDSCGDLNAGDYGGVSSGKQGVTITIPGVLCQDTDGDGFLNLPNCTSWHSNAGTACNRTDNNAFDSAPDTKSKCVCDDQFQVPVVVEKGSITVTKDASPSSLPEPGGQFTYTVSVTNTAAIPTITINKICDDKFGQVAIASGQQACAVGSIGSIDAGTSTCVLPHDVAPGATYSCSFKASLAGLPVTGADTGTTDTVTDTVTFIGVDSNTPPNAVTGSDTAQVKITNVQPSATVVKSLDGIACADVDYKVKVTNTDTGESITLSKLLDSQFGDITLTSTSTPTPNPKVLSTTCAVPVTVGSTPYECTFRAHFCGGSDTDKVTATIGDNDGNSTGTDSNSLTVNVCATTSSATCPGP